MPIYFFDVQDGKTVVNDGGQDCADLAAARQVAISFLAQKLSDTSLWNGSIWTIAVRDEDGKAVATIVFSAESRD